MKDFRVRIFPCFVRMYCFSSKQNQEMWLQYANPRCTKNYFFYILCTYLSPLLLSFGLGCTACEPKTVMVGQIPTAEAEAEAIPSFVSICRR